MMSPPGREDEPPDRKTYRHSLGKTCLPPSLVKGAYRFLQVVSRDLGVPRVEEVSGVILQSSLCLIRLDLKSLLVVVGWFVKVLKTL